MSNAGAMEDDELLRLLAEIESRRAAAKAQLDELARTQFWAYAALGAAMSMLVIALLFMAGCAFFRR